MTFPRTHTHIYIYVCLCVCVCGGGSVSSVDVAEDYGLDGPVSNPGRDEIFRPSKPALGPTRPPVQWVPGLSRVRGDRGVGLTPTPSRVPRS